MSDQKKTILVKNGRVYYKKESERKLFFVLTIIMLLLGILAKIGFF